MPGSECYSKDIGPAVQSHTGLCEGFPPPPANISWIRTQLDTFEDRSWTSLLPEASQFPLTGWPAWKLHTFAFKADGHTGSPAFPVATQWGRERNMKGWREKQGSRNRWIGVSWLPDPPSCVQEGPAEVKCEIIINCSVPARTRGVRDRHTRPQLSSSTWFWKSLPFVVAFWFRSAKKAKTDERMLEAFYVTTKLFTSSVLQSLRRKKIWPGHRLQKLSYFHGYFSHPLRFCDCV